MNLSIGICLYIFIYGVILMVLFVYWFPPRWERGSSILPVDPARVSEDLVSSDSNLL